MSRPPAYHAGESPRQIRNNLSRPDWVLIGLAVLAVLSRVIWALWVHPPRDHVFSDMAHYVYRARLVASWEIAPGDRAMVWQAWGTHALLALPMILLGYGEAALELAGLMWAGFSAATVVFGYRLAARVLLPSGSGPPASNTPQKIASRFFGTPSELRPFGPPLGPRWPAIAVGVALLLWFPLLSHTGFFISETPYACSLLATTYWIVAQIQDGRGAGRAGLWGALAFALRPQVAVFFGLLGLAWLMDRRRQRWSTHADYRAALRLATPLTVVLVISLIRTWFYTGELGGVAESGAMNLTAARCHNIVTRSFPDQAALESAQATGEPEPTRRVSLPGFRALDRKGPDHPLALRPALGGESIDLVGHIGDRELHREIRRRCYAATGVTGQLRYSVTNVALTWVIARPWPESSDHPAPELLPVAMRGRDIAAWLAPLGLLGLLVGLRRWAALTAGGDASPIEGPIVGQIAGLGVCALQLLSLLITVAVFFGAPRLRTPYDPYVLILIAGLALGRGTGLPSRTRTPP